MEIRLATLNDIHPICQLYNEFYAYNANLQPKYYNAAQENGEYPRSTIQNADSDIFIAVENDLVLGFIHIREVQTPPFDERSNKKAMQNAYRIPEAEFHEGNTLLT